MCTVACGDAAVETTTPGADTGIPVSSTTAAPATTTTAAQLGPDAEPCFLQHEIGRAIPLQGIVYVTEAPAFAFVTMYPTDTEYFAPDCGEWYVTDTPAFADFAVYFTECAPCADLAVQISH